MVRNKIYGSIQNTIDQVRKKQRRRRKQNKKPHNVVKSVERELDYCLEQLVKKTEKIQQEHKQ